LVDAFMAFMGTVDFFWFLPCRERLSRSMFSLPTSPQVCGMAAAAGVADFLELLFSLDVFKLAGGGFRLFACGCRSVGGREFGANPEELIM
jgi:hypothetical protein